MILLYISGAIMLSWLSKQAGLDRSSVAISAIGSILFLPVFVSLMNGQDTALLFLGAAIWMYGLVSEDEFLAGVGLSLTTVRPHIAVILALPMLFRYRKVFVGFALGAGGLALLSVLILGMNGVQEFIDVLLITAGGEWYGTKQFAMFNLIGLLTRTFPLLEADTIRTFGWVIYGMMTIFLCIFWARTKDLQTGQIGLTVILVLFSVPHLHFHDLTLLLIPIYDLIRLSKQDSHPKTSIATTLPVTISLILLLSNVSPLLQYTVPYFIMLALAIWPLYAKRQSTLIAQSQS